MLILQINYDYCNNQIFQNSASDMPPPPPPPQNKERTCSRTGFVSGFGLKSSSLATAGLVVVVATIVVALTTDAIMNDLRLFGVDDDDDDDDEEEEKTDEPVAMET